MDLSVCFFNDIVFDFQASS